MKRILIAALVVCGLTAGTYAGYTRLTAPVVAPDEIEEPPVTVPVTRGDVSQTVAAPGTLAGTRDTDLSFDVAGRIATLHVKPGQAVRAGALLASLDPRELRAAAEDRHADFISAQLSYSLTVRGPDPADVRAARSALAAAQADGAALRLPPGEGDLAVVRATLQDAELTLRQAQFAYDNAFRADPAAIGASPEAAGLERATNALTAAKAAYDRLFDAPDAARERAAVAAIAQAQARLIALAPVSETVALAQQRMLQAERAWQRAQADLLRVELRAPFDGVVLELRPRVGERIAAGQSVATLTDPRALEFKASVIEEDLPLVRVGQPVELYLDAAPDVPVTGTVSRVVPQRLPGDRPLFPVYVALDRVPEGVLAGMSADGSVIIARRDDVLQLPRALVRPRSDGAATVEVVANGILEQRAITVGLRGDVYVEVLDGLREGERVVSK